MRLYKIKQDLDRLNKDFKDLKKINKNKIITFINDLKCLLFSKTFDKRVNIRKISLNFKNILKSVNIINKNEITFNFFNSLAGIKEVLLKDLSSYILKDPACKSIDEVVLSYNSFHAIYIYRIANLLYNLNIDIIPKFLSEYSHSITGIDIHPACKINEYFFIDHGTGIVIGETTVIGKNVSIYQGVTLGAKSLKDASLLKGVKRHPTILDNVVIYANATILGGETIIKEHSIIPGNAFITCSN